MRRLVLASAIALATLAAVGERSARAECVEYTFVYAGVTYNYTYDAVTAVYGCVAGPSRADATNHIIYLHGRSMTYWPAAATMPLAQLPADWNNITLTYDGNRRLADYTVATTIKDALRANCTGAHSCVVITYSSGMNRLLYAVNALNAEGTPPTNLLYTQAISSSAGGTPVARYTSKWWKKLIAKLFGGYADVDKDLHDTDWQGGRFAYLQNLMPSPVYHVGAGLRDQCVKIRVLFFKFKLCGNKEMPSRRGDGAVPVFSSCGYADRGTYSSCCDAGWKYANRDFESFGYCSYQQNHTQMLNQGFQVVANRLVGTVAGIANDGAAIASDFADLPDCNPAYDDCDLQEADGVPHFYEYQYIENNELSWRGATCDGIPCAMTSMGNVSAPICYYDYYIGYYCTYTIVTAGVTQTCLDFGTGEPYCY